ncbi:MFS general substrate transporter [Karstenula rhodostoma CBS 690.94]|uniref:MFS general substrate transporter n=1 Tax=Karstenula rhodostoma CBS 690.94 TaxID=1392251 RepID=A0A9P4P8H4_9PLEO|nr:MFS general substrate transporter [Karstenula rhodostoma CBS 690.94]
MGGLSHLRVNTYTLLLVILVGLGTISTAYGLAIIGSTVGQPNFYTSILRRQNRSLRRNAGYAHTMNMIGALNDVKSAGAIFGCLFNAWISEKYSRKYSMTGGCVVIVGGALCGSAYNVAMFFVGRFIAGWGAVMLACVIPMYQAEISTPETRGTMVCMTGIFTWRFPLAFQCFFPLMVLGGWKFIPISPRWLLQQDRREEALEVVKKPHASSNDPNHVRAHEEFFLIEKQYELNRTMLVRRFELFRTPANRRRALVSFLPMWGDRLLGIFDDSLTVDSYDVLFYASLGLTGFVPLLLNACWTTFTIFGNIWTRYRSPLTAEYLGTTNVAGLRATVFFIFFYIFWWCFSIDATQYVHPSGVWERSSRTRPQGVVLGLSAFYLASEITLVGAPVALEKIRWRFPETKGRTLEEIGVLFGDEHIASRWYGISEAEKEKLAHEAILELLENGEDAGTGSEKAGATMTERVGGGGRQYKRTGSAPRNRGFSWLLIGLCT